MEIFPNPIICLDSDDSGQKAALRIAENLFPLINEKNKIYFSIMPNGKDPDDYIKQNGKDTCWTYLVRKRLFKILFGAIIWGKDQNNPYEISNFEKIKSLCYSIKDETLKKYIIEDF